MSCREQTLHAQVNHIELAVSLAYSEFGEYMCVIYVCAYRVVHHSPAGVREIGNISDLRSHCHRAINNSDIDRRSNNKRIVRYHQPSVLYDERIMRTCFPVVAVALSPEGPFVTFNETNVMSEIHKKDVREMSESHKKIWCGNVKIYHQGFVRVNEFEEQEFTTGKGRRPGCSECLRPVSRFGCVLSHVRAFKSQA